MILVYKTGIMERWIAKQSQEVITLCTSQSARSFQQQVATQYEKSHQFFPECQEPKQFLTCWSFTYSAIIFISLSWENVKVVTNIYCILRIEGKVQKVQKLFL